MRNLIAIFVFLSTAIHAFGQDISIGKRDRVFSEILNQEREISIYLPPGYHSEPDQKYPVLYILDGDYNFQYVAGLLELEGGISERIPKMILVAISGKGTDTYRHNCKPNIEGVEDKGNADEFAGFLASELIPYVDSKYKTNDFKILSGHSIGGLFVVNTALNRPNLFDRYIAISPALWWADNAINQVAEEKVKAVDFNTDVFVSLADEKGMGVDGFLLVATGSVLKNKVVIYGIAILFVAFALFWGIRRKRIFFPVVLALAGMGVSAYLLFYYYPQNENFTFKKFPAENHNSVGEPTYRWALQEIFKPWSVEREYFETADAMKGHYDKVKSDYGSAFNIPFSVLGHTYYVLQDNPEELAKVADMLKVNYPNAFETFAVYGAGRLLDEKPNESEKWLREVLAIHPYSFESHHLLAKLKFAENDTAQARSSIHQALVLARDQNARQWQINELMETNREIGGDTKKDVDAISTTVLNEQILMVLENEELFKSLLNKDHLGDTAIFIDVSNYDMFYSSEPFQNKGFKTYYWRPMDLFFFNIAGPRFKIAYYADDPYRTRCEFLIYSSGKGFYVDVEFIHADMVKRTRIPTRIGKMEISQIKTVQN